MRVMVIGASRDRSKYGNKAVRAYQRQGHEVIPIHPSEPEIEGLTAHADVRDPAGPVDRATLYLPPEKGEQILEPLAERGDVGELWVNPGAESKAVMEKALGLGFEVIQACSITDIDESP